MPLLKSISGHTSCKGAYRHLTKDGQALAANYLNLDAPEQKKTKQEMKFLLGLCSAVCSNTSISEDTEPQGSSRQNQMRVASNRCTLSMESLRCSCWQ